MKGMHMKQRRIIRSRFRRRSGTATIEFVMCVPLLATILGLTFFFGWAMKNQQHVRISDRYLAWRQIRNGTSPSGADINVTFFARQASDVSVSGGSGPGETSDDFVKKANEVANSAGSLAQHVVDRSPASSVIRVGAEFPSQVGTWQYFTGKINSAHSREGVEWRYHEASCSDAVIRDYLNDLDTILKGLNDPLAEVFRNMYQTGW